MPRKQEGPTKLTITNPGERQKCLEVWWYGDGEVFINQIERETGIEHLIVFGSDACRALIIALQQSQPK